MLARSVLILSAELTPKLSWLRSCRDVRSAFTCLHVLLFAVDAAGLAAGDAGLVVGDAGLVVGDAGLVVGDADFAMADPECDICDPECEDGLAGEPVVCGTAALLALLLPVPELHAVRITAAPAISAADAVLTGATGLTGLTGLIGLIGLIRPIGLTRLTCHCLTMQTWSPPDVTQRHPQRARSRRTRSARGSVHAGLWPQY
jgi:hypothetical protein